MDKLRAAIFRHRYNGQLDEIRKAFLELEAKQSPWLKTLWQKVIGWFRRVE